MVGSIAAAFTGDDHPGLSPSSRAPCRWALFFSLPLEAAASPGPSFSSDPEGVRKGSAVAPLGKSFAFGLSLVKAGPSSNLLGSRSLALPVLSSG